MDGEVFGYLIKPDHVQVANPLFIVLFIPIFQFLLYPVIEKVLFINTPLRKLTIGGLLAALAFIISGLVELKLEVRIKMEAIKIYCIIRIHYVSQGRGVAYNSPSGS